LVSLVVLETDLTQAVVAVQAGQAAIAAAGATVEQRRLMA
jgi:hypothetical protein